MIETPTLHPVLVQGASPATGELLKQVDWSSTPLGPLEGWPQSLRIAVSICLNSRFPMFVWWGPTQINIYNDAYIPMLGKRHPRAFGRPAQESWSEIWDVVGPQKDAVMRGEATWNERVLLMMERKGFLEETYFTWSYSPIYQEDGKVGGLFCAVTEETARVMAERERDALVLQAQDTASRLQNWFNNAPGFIALLRGPEFVFELANKAYHQLVGHRDIIGKRVFDAVPEVREQGFEKILTDVYRTRQPFIARALRVELQREPGLPMVERYLDLVYQPVIDGAGMVTGIFAQGHDVTEQVQAVQALKEADQRKDEFLATLAHELRNPLAPIRQAAALARMSAVTPEKRDWALGVIERQAAQMSVLMDDLLDLSRVSRGKLELRRAQVDVRDVIRGALETAQPLIESKGHRMTVTLPTYPVRVDGDALRLSQVLANLLSNAAKYTDRGGHIEVFVTDAPQQLAIHVRDNGIGLEPDDCEKIFNMFSQVSSALDRSEGGLGIGLALSRGLVDMHGGSIEAHSTGRGHGSEFIVRLPRLPVPGAAGADRQVQAQVDADAPAGRRILVVDDNADALETLAMLLQVEGHSVFTARDGNEALAAAARDHVDTVVLDIGMPGMNGYEVARRLRAEHGTGLVLVALTGWGQEQDQQRARESGFDFHCTKPVDLGELVGILSRTQR